MEGDARRRSHARRPRRTLAERGTPVVAPVTVTVKVIAAMPEPTEIGTITIGEGAALRPGAIDRQVEAAMRALTQRLAFEGSDWLHDPPSRADEDDLVA